MEYYITEVRVERLLFCGAVYYAVQGGSNFGVSG